MRTMRFPVALELEESIPGGLVRGVRLNVLERSSIFFKDSGVAARKAGLTQVMSPDELLALSEHLGCEPDALLRQAGQAGDAQVAFGDLRLLRGDVQFSRRRIAPTTLLERPFHHSAWLFRLLPFCPFSLERLVDVCALCGSALGWSRCWGVGKCESCRETVGPSTEPPLGSALAANYRLFASLMSPVAERRQEALSSLPEVLREVEPGTLVHMALRFGQVCRPEPVTHVRRESIARLDPQLLADIVATGTSILRGWPDTFVDQTRAALSDHLADLPAYHAVRQGVKRLGNSLKEDATQVRLVREALPSEFASFSRSAPQGQFMTLLETRSMAHLRPGQVRLVREGLEDRRLPGVARTRSQFNPEKVAAFASRYRGSRRPTRLTFELMLPTYAIEQMICTGLLEQEGDELVRLARGGVCVTADAFEGLAAMIRCRASTGSMPATAKPLNAAVRRIGGREKPWASIMRSLCDGAVPFWLPVPEVTCRTIRVMPADMARFDCVAFDRAAHPRFTFTSNFAKCEAEEVLNTFLKGLMPHLDEKQIAFQRNGRAHRVQREEVLQIAERMCGFAELSAHTGWTYRDACDEGVRLGIGRVFNGWNRNDLEARRLIPRTISTV